MDIQKIMNLISEVDYYVMDQADWNEEIGILITGNEAQEFVNAYRSLEMLVRAKLVKDNQGETTEYKQQKEIAWLHAFRCFDTTSMLKEQANEILSKMAELSEIHDKIKSQL